jgi:hypothetical protein
MTEGHPFGGYRNLTRGRGQTVTPPPLDRCQNVTKGRGQTVTYRIGDKPSPHKINKNIYLQKKGTQPAASACVEDAAEPPSPAAAGNETTPGKQRPISL